MNEKERPWIEHGYHVFAYEGPQGLKIERLSKGVGKNKSSFYHYFADLEIFTDQLLQYHLTKTELIAQKESNCTSLQELIGILLEHKIDLLFNRQLRIHRENPNFEACFTRTNQITIPATMGIWTQILDLQDNSYLAGLVFKLSIENFYLQITDETLNKEWLNNYFKELHTLIQGFKNRRTVSELDGSV